MGRRLLIIVNQLGQSYIMVGQSQMGTESDHIYYSSMAGVGLLLCLVQAAANRAKLQGQNHFAEPNQHVLTFSSSNFQFAESDTEHWWSCSKEEVLSVLGPLGCTFELDVNMVPRFS